MKRFTQASQYHQAQGIETEELAHADFRKSRLSAQGNCVEVAQLKAGRVAVRDSKDPQGAVLVFSRTEWAAFTGGVKQKEFDF